MTEGFKKDGKFRPTGKGGGLSEKDLTKPFTGYSISEKKKVRVTKDIHVTRKALKNGNDVIIVKGKSDKGNTVCRIVGQVKRK